MPTKASALTRCKTSGQLIASMLALDVRMGLNRCFLAAERLRYEAEANQGLPTSPTRPRLVLANPD